MLDLSENTTSPPSAAGRFGAFSGVFTPSILTILGVIMYLRLGWVTGQAGLLGAIAIVLLSHTITAATGLSVSAIATNRIVGAGGAYNIISRSLGAPVGAAIGIPLFLAQALSVTFYIVGFTESVQALVPTLDVRLWGSIALMVLVGISAKSADLAIKSQYIVMAAIAASLVSLVLGGNDSPPSEIIWINHGGESFGTVFAVFFPAVTGIMAGVGMSGDLRDSRRDLPRGTLAAIAVGLVVYLFMPIYLATHASTHTLITEKDVVWGLSRWPQLIFVGVWGATISSAVGSILTAPRTLQALAQDGLAPAALAAGVGPNNEPRIGMAVTFALAECGILLGNLDVIAPILTMFFLATYGLTNLACGLERWAASPSYRPSFKVSAWVSLGGALACFYVMSIIHLPAMLVALGFCFAIFVVTERRDLDLTYGDARHGLWSALVRAALLNLRKLPFHPGNWRPNLVILGGHPDERPWLLEVGEAIVQRRGMVTYFQLLEGSVAERSTQAAHLQATVEPRLLAEHPTVFYRAEVVPEVFPGAVSVVQSYGVGPFQANTALLGWPREAKGPEHADGYLAMLRDLAQLEKSLFLINWQPSRGLGQRRSIHVWWGGLQGNGGLMLLLAHLLLGDRRWQGADVTVVTVVETETQRAEASRSMSGILEAARLRATVQVLLRRQRPIQDIMSEVSSGADLAILGIGLPDDEASAFFERMQTMLAAMPTTVLVHSSRNFEGEPVLFQTAEG